MRRFARERSPFHEFRRLGIPHRLTHSCQSLSKSDPSQRLGKPTLLLVHDDHVSTLMDLDQQALVGDRRCCFLFAGRPGLQDPQLHPDHDERRHEQESALFVKGSHRGAPTDSGVSHHACEHTVMSSLPGFGRIRAMIGDNCRWRIHAGAGNYMRERNRAMGNETGRDGHPLTARRDKCLNQKSTRARTPKPQESPTAERVGMMYCTSGVMWNHVVGE